MQTGWIANSPLLFLPIGQQQQQQHSTKLGKFIHLYSFHCQGYLMWAFLALWPIFTNNFRTPKKSQVFIIDPSIVSCFPVSIYWKNTQLSWTLLSHFLQKTKSDKTKHRQIRYKVVLITIKAEKMSPYSDKTLVGKEKKSFIYHKSLWKNLTCQNCKIIQISMVQKKLGKIPSQR